MVDIGMVELGYHHVHQSASLLALSVDNHIVGWCYHDDRYESDVLRKTAVFLAVALEVLLRATLHSAINNFGLSLVGGISAL